MIYANQILPLSLDLWKGKRFWMNYSSDFHLLNMLYNEKIDMEKINSAPSVANTAFDLLSKMGCNPIIFMGQDLAYTNNRQYAGNLEHDCNKDGNIDFSNHIKMKDIYGNEVYTTYSFLSMRNNFETTITAAKERNPELKVLNCTEGGINIEGAENSVLLDVIKNLNLDNDIAKKISELYNNNKLDGEFKSKVDKFNDYLKNNLLQIKEYINEQRDLIKKLNNTKLSKNNKTANLTKRIDELSKKYLGNDVFRIMLNHIVHVDFFYINVLFNKKQLETKSDYGKLENYKNTISSQNKILDGEVDKLLKIL
jgi:hypothetical protein